MERVIAPPRIPEDIRREALAAAQSNTRRGRLRRASPSRRDVAPYAWLCKPVPSPRAADAKSTSDNGAPSVRRYFSSRHDASASGARSASSYGSTSSAATTATATSTSAALRGGCGSSSSSSSSNGPQHAASLKKSKSTMGAPSSAASPLGKISTERSRTRSFPPVTRCTSPGDARGASRPRFVAEQRSESDISGTNTSARSSSPGVDIMTMLPATAHAGAAHKRSNSAGALRSECSRAGESIRMAYLRPEEAKRAARDAKLRFEELRKISGNSRCADCRGRCADWASVTHGSFVCLNCAGRHRKLGVHVTFTRSLTMDQWTEGGLRRMEVGGNQRLAEFVRQAGLYPWSSIDDKYGHPCLGLYREYIAALSEGREPPALSRETLEKAVLDASGESFSDDEADLFPIRSLVSGCGGLGHVFRRWTRLHSGVRAVGTCGRGGEGATPEWVPDEESDACMLCGSEFTLVRRRHHCRRCGRLACMFCAPTENTRPIVEWGLPDAVRHCHHCYRSPMLEWTNLPTTRSD